MNEVSIIQSIGDNVMNNGQDRITNSYDFIGQLTSSVSTPAQESFVINSIGVILGRRYSTDFSSLV